MPTCLHRATKTSVLIAIATVTGVSNVTAAPSYAKHKTIPHFTEVRVLTPFNSQGVNELIKIKDHVEGTCWATSTLTSAQPNTWRCQAGNKTYDPCFINPIRHDNTVVCLSNPWDHSGVEITLSNPLPLNRGKPFSDKSAQPWALELANGNHCTLISGPSLSFAGLKATYRCQDALVVGKINRSNQLWTVLYSPNSALYMNQTAVLAAWY